MSEQLPVCLNRQININQNEYLIDQQYVDDISWITTNKNGKEYIYIYIYIKTVPNAVIDKNLLVNPEKNRRILYKIDHQIKIGKNVNT